ncbi:pilus assembly protein TadG-related protein [Shewanella piezotolerans]|nr:pilus assembly protein TadG-related protein [Shewanella piezotolerans]
MLSTHRKMKGIVAPLAVVSLLTLLALAGLALDSGKVFSDYRRAQTAADAAALAGAFEKFYGRDGGIISAADAEAVANGFTHGDDGINVAINNPPLSGFYVGDPFSVEVIITQPTLTFFSRVLGINSIPYTVRAVANGNTASGNNCVYVLDDNEEKAFEVSSDSLLDARCGIWVNSDDNEASSVESGACVKAGTITVVGGFKKNQNCDSGGDAYQCDNPGDCPLSGKGLPAAQSPLPAPDPFSGLPTPTVDRSSGACPNEEQCDATGCSGKKKDSNGPYESYTVDKSGNSTLNPGTYCGGILVKKGNVTFNPGVYILRGGGLRIEGSDSEATGSGVSFYNTCYFDCNSSGNKDPEKGKEWYWTLDINSSAEVDFSAPLCNGGSSGTACENDLDGVLFFSDRDAPSSKDPGAYPVNRIDSSVTATLAGAIYVWNQHLKFHSGSSGNPSDAILVSKFLEISSGSEVEITNFTGAGGSPLKRVTLVE